MLWNYTTPCNHCIGLLRAFVSALRFARIDFSNHVSRLKSLLLNFCWFIVFVWALPPMWTAINRPYLHTWVLTSLRLFKHLVFYDYAWVTRWHWLLDCYQNQEHVISFACKTWYFFYILKKHFYAHYNKVPTWLNL